MLTSGEVVAGILMRLAGSSDANMMRVAETELANAMQTMDHTKRRRAFTLLEFLVGLAILVILIGIIIPFTFSVREKERRTRCSDNLRKIGIALNEYGRDNRYELPRVTYAEKEMPHGYTAYTGASSADPFRDGVKPNDVTASLWLLLRGGYTPSTSTFICPSSGDTPDLISIGHGGEIRPRDRGNFSGRENLSYSYASPFSNAPGYGLKSDFLPKDFVLMADKNPGKRSSRHDVTAVNPDAPPLEMKVANSRNHGGGGQNVLFGDMHVEFRSTPYCGVDGDNIYTALASEPIMTGEAPDFRSRGYVGSTVGPAWPTDSYLVPTESDEKAMLRAQAE